MARVPLRGNVPLAGLAGAGISTQMAAALDHAPSGAGVAWGISFEIGDVVVVKDQINTVGLPPADELVRCGMCALLLSS